MSKDNIDPNEQLEKIRSVKFEQSLDYYAPNPSQEVKVNIRPDTSVTRGKFKQDPLAPGHYKAHPSTIRALRGDIFVTGANESDEMFIELECIVKCESCKSDVDRQFWKFCPYCETSFPQN